MSSEAESLEQRVARFLVQDVAPALHLDATALEVIEIRDGVARIRLGGMCAGCPGTVMAVISGIEQELRRRVPEIRCIEALP
jgi:Fe-S cluster biogenesis protein NfuA